MYFVQYEVTEKQQTGEIKGAYYGLSIKEIKGFASILLLVWCIDY